MANCTITSSSSLISCHACEGAVAPQVYRKGHYPISRYSELEKISRLGGRCPKARRNVHNASSPTILGGECAKWVQADCGRFHNQLVQSKKFSSWLEARGIEVTQKGDKYYARIRARNARKARSVFHKLFRTAFWAVGHSYCFEHGPGCRDSYVMKFRG